MQIRIIGNRVKVPNRPAAVIGELNSQCHWETGKARNASILESEDLPLLCTNTSQDIEGYAKAGIIQCLI